MYTHTHTWRWFLRESLLGLVQRETNRKPIMLGLYFDTCSSVPSLKTNATNGSKSASQNKCTTPGTNVQNTPPSTSIHAACSFVGLRTGCLVFQVNPFPKEEDRGHFGGLGWSEKNVGVRLNYLVHPGIMNSLRYRGWAVDGAFRVSWEFFREPWGTRPWTTLC